MTGTCKSVQADHHRTWASGYCNKIIMSCATQEKKNTNEEHICQREKETKSGRQGKKNI